MPALLGALVWAAVAAPGGRAQAAAYAWLGARRSTGTIASRIPPPPGFERVPVSTGSFGEWLRGLPLKPAGSPVLLYDGRRKPRQDAHAAVVDMDVGRRDLQQCADAVMRLRAEYLYAFGRYGEIAFRATSGEMVPYARWRAGERAVERRDRVAWVPGKADGGYREFRRYLEFVFGYAGTDSLSRELADAGPGIRIGDVFMKGGFPGHAVLVADLAADPRTGREVFLLVQSYMPAQEVHVLVNKNDAALSPWYDAAGVPGGLSTPEWDFGPGSLRRFPLIGPP